MMPPASRCVTADTNLHNFSAYQTVAGTATHEPQDQQNSTAGLAQDDHCLELGSSIRPSTACQTGVAKYRSQGLTT